MYIKKYKSYSIICVIILVIVSHTNCANILGIFPFSAKSHYAMFEPLMLELSKRGHNVTVVSAFPQDKPVANFTDIDGSSYLINLVAGLDVTNYEKIPNDPFTNVFKTYESIHSVEKLFEIPGVQHLLHSTDVYFDLIVTELFNTDVTLGFVHKFNAPVITLSSCGLLPWANARFGNPDNPSYIPVTFSGLSEYMDFWDRMYNMFGCLVGKIAFHVCFNERSEYIARKYFVGELPPLIEIGKNTTLILVNTHHSLHGTRPFVPAVIEVGGMHVREPKKLPLVRWL